MSWTGNDPNISDRVHREANEQRGEFIGAINDVELALGLALSEAFGVPEYMHYDLLTVVFARMSLSQKIEALRGVATIYGLQMDVVGRLKELNTFRNMLAHQLPTTSSGTFTNGIVYYLRMRDGENKVVEVTSADMNRKIAEAESVRGELQTEVGPRFEAGLLERRERDRILKTMLAKPPISVDEAIGQLDSGVAIDGGSQDEAPSVDR